ncbi:hypothetical protein O7623_09000 [Solwaraspora sp. WMMD791]|uniref:hypothetical protein n=1 Tax=Solwaraspora sp. WMMD791 TaxID=3016086 RepID=UPI00249ABADB|nr:hypothetical protein [Solwaraspora sp. WMMD791]WFE29308.1 hypothetical protein O7623_09000 [Solwaraspora sp. WMMD791]
MRERRRSPMTGLAVAGAVIVILAVVTAVLVVAVTRSGGPVDEFEQAAEQFHSRYEPLARQLETNLDRAGAGMFDPGLATAQQDARALADLFDEYGTALAGIEFPADAEPAATQLANAVEAGKVLWVNAAGFFDKGPMESLIDELRPQTEAAIAEREESLRQALSG